MKKLCDKKERGAREEKKPLQTNYEKEKKLDDEKEKKLDNEKEKKPLQSVFTPYKPDYKWRLYKKGTILQRNRTKLADEKEKLADEKEKLADEKEKVDVGADPIEGQETARIVYPRKKWYGRGVHSPETVEK